MSASETAERGISTHRVEGLADAVFAIVMTLLVIDLRAPHAASTAALAGALFERWTDFLSYAISFVVVAVMWFGHRMEFHYITKMDRRSVLLSLFFLGAITFLPFSTALLAKNFHQPLAAAIFGFNIFVASVFRWWHWHHAGRRRLIRDDAPPKMVKSIQFRTLLVPILYLVASAVCAASPSSPS